MRYIESPSESVTPGNVNRFKMSYTHVIGTQSVSLSLKKQEMPTRQQREGQDQKPPSVNIPRIPEQLQRPVPPATHPRGHGVSKWRSSGSRAQKKAFSWVGDAVDTAPWYHPLPSEVSITPRLWSGKQICCDHVAKVALLSLLAGVGRTEQLTSRKCSVTVCYFVPGLGRLENSPSKQSLWPVSSLPFPQNLNSWILPWGFIENSPSGIFCWQKASNWCQPEKTQPSPLLSSRKVWPSSQASLQPGRAADASKAPAPRPGWSGWVNCIEVTWSLWNSLENENNHTRHSVVVRVVILASHIIWLLTKKMC